MNKILYNMHHGKKINIYVRKNNLKKIYSKGCTTVTVCLHRIQTDTSNWVTIKNPLLQYSNSQ